MDGVRSERGQATLVMVAVVAVGLLLMLAVAGFGAAVVHRARARTAADAVALAAVVDPRAADELAAWYGDHGMPTSHADGSSHARSGPSQAGAWAELVDDEVRVAPALVAIMARAGQLLDAPLAPLAMSGTAVALSPADGAALDSIASGLGLCEAPEHDLASIGRVFLLC